MLKTMLFGSLAVLSALVLSVSTHGARTPRASAATTDVVVIGCELIAPYVDGDPTNVVTDRDVARACGGTVGGTATTLPAVMFPPANPGGTLQSIEKLAKAIGNGDGKLTASDFRSGLVDENWDDNQISTDCSIKLGAGNYGSTVDQLNKGFACTLDVFVFVNDESPVTIDMDAGLATIESGTANFVCNSDATDVFAGPNLAETGAGLALPPVGTEDHDCNGGGTPGTGAENNGDGVVLFHVLNDNAKAGTAKAVRVTQEDVTQSFTVNVVGPANNVQMKLAENVIETNKTTPNVLRCIGNAADTSISPRGIPGRDVADPLTIDAPTSTLGWAVVTDQDNMVLTRVPVTFVVTPPEDKEIVRLGVGNVLALTTGNTKFTRDPGGGGAVAAYVVICGGNETGKAMINASINAISCTETGCTVLNSQDHDRPTVAVVGAPSTVVLTADHSAIKCDGSETSTVTAKVTDSTGDNVADGVPVNFTVVARGTAKPALTVTKDGIASTQITPFSESSEGITVLVTAGDSAIAALVDVSTRVDCALALSPAPPPAPGGAAAGAGAAPAPALAGIHGPDTGSGGAGAPDAPTVWPLLALVGAALALAGVRLAANQR